MKTLFAASALAAAAAFGLLCSLAASAPLVEQLYETTCVLVDAGTIEGYVTNRGTTLLQVNGPVRFSFTLMGSMSRPMVQAQAAALVSPGRTVSVGRARLAGNVLPGTSCRLDISTALSD